MLSLTRAQALGLILLFGFCARAVSYRAPLLDHHAWRQADTATISRNFLRESFNPFYPQVDWRGAQSRGYVETGFEAVAFIVAAISKVSGRFQPEIGRVLAIVCFLCAAFLTDTFARRRYGDTLGLIAAFVYAFGFPLALFIDRAFMNESMLIALSIGSLVLAQRYLERRNLVPLLALAALTALVGAIKLPYLIVWAPIAGLFAERFGWRAFVRWDLLFVFVVDLAVAGAWYSHAHALAAATGFTFGMTDKLFDPALVFSLSFPLHLARQLFKDIFGLSLVFFIVGAVVAWQRRRLCELFAIGGYLAYLLILARGNAMHDYYQLPIVVIAPIVTALGVVAAARWLGGRRARPATAAIPLLLGLIVFSTLLRSVSANSWYDVDPNLVQACAQSASFLRPDDRLVFPDNSDPKLLFCMDRKGWLLPVANSHAREMVEVTTAGATVGVVLKESGPTEAAGWWAAHGAAVFENPALVAYRLR